MFSSIKWWIYGGIAASLIGLFVYQKIQISYHKSRFAAVSSENVVLKFNASILKSALEIQNKNINDAANKSKALDGEIEKLKITISKQESSNNKKIKELISQKTPQTCDESLDYLNNTLREIKWVN